MKKNIFYCTMVLFVVIVNITSKAQIIYQHNFDTGIIGGSATYTTSAPIIDPFLSSTGWSTTPTSFTALAGNTGSALSLNNSQGSPTYSLQLTIGAGYVCDITAFSFWTRHSGSGANSWTLSVNNSIVLGSGNTPSTTTTGTSTGTINVSNPANGLSGTINLVLQLAGGTSSTGTFRLDDFTLYGTLTPTSICTPPTLQASTFTTSSVGVNSATVNWTSGNGGNVIVLAKQASAVNATPSNGVSYVANSVFGSGQQVGTGNYVVYNGVGNSVTVTGLNAASDYYFAVYEYNTTSGSPCYLTPALTGSITTTSAATSTNCLQIKTILVAACGAPESYNEMVYFKNGPSPLPINQLSIAGAPASGVYALNKWPNNSNAWFGIVQNTLTASNVNAVNGFITKCGVVLEPPVVSGVVTIPANANVVLVGHQSMNPSANSFANLTDTVYMIFQAAATSTAGNFTNSGTGTRGFVLIDNLHGCTSNSITYTPASLATGGNNGDVISFDANNNITYYNSGCQAPFIPLGVNAGNDQTICYNGSSILTATPSGVYNSMLWSGGTGTFSSSSSLTTTYTAGAGDSGPVKIYCTITRSCASSTLTAKDSVYINVIHLPQFNINATNGFSLCPNATSVISYSITNASVAGVVSPSWSSPAGSNSTYTVSSSGSSSPVTYTLNLSNTCGNTLQTFTVYPLESPSVSLSVNSLTACAGSTLSLSATGNTGNYSWNNPVSTNSTVTITANTTTTGVVTSTNSCGTATDSYTLLVTQTPLLTVDNPNVSLCSGQTATVSASSSAGTYTWMPGSITTNTIALSSAGNYTVTSANNCFVTTETVSVIVSSVPTITISSFTSSVSSLCSNGSQVMVLSATGSIGTYSWSTGATTPTISVSTPGVYTATVTTSSCGTAIDSYTITSTPNPSITLISNTFTACAGSAVSVVANSTENNYSWSNSANTTATLALAVSNPITGVVTTTNACGSASANYTITVTQTPTLLVDNANVSLCSGQTASVTATSSEGTYTWMPGSINTSTIAITSPGDYTVTTANACFVITETVNVVVSSQPTVTINSNATLSSLCSNGSQSMVLSASGSVGTYSWSTGVTTSTVSVSTPGVYSATVTTSSCGTAVDSYTISSIPNPSVTLTPNTFSACAGNTINIIANSTENNYSWSSSANTTATLSLAVSGSTTGVVTTTNACGSAYDNYTVTVTQSPTLTVDHSTADLCSGETDVFVANSSTNTYTWLPGSINTNSISVSSAGVYTVSTSNACGTKTETVLVNVVSVNASLSANPTSGVKPILVSFTNNSTGATSYGWTFGNGVSANMQTVSAQTYSAAGIYTVYLLATNGTCSDLDSVLINVLNEEPDLIVPNVFTPNNDSINDVFKVKGFNIVSFECTVIDRWGLQLFQWNDINKGWDGKVNGKDVPDGTYFYIINAKDINDKEIKRQGSVNLFK